MGMAEALVDMGGAAEEPMRRNLLFSAHRGAPSGERGAILVFAALLMGVILAFLALAIDVTLMHSAARAGRDHAALAALRALETYYAHQCTGACGTQKEEAALQAVIDLEEKYPFTDHKQIVLASQASPNQTDASTLTFGRWTEDNCPSGKKYCFDSQLIGNTTPNAVRIEGKFFGTFSTFFSRAAFHYIPESASVSATASVVPRNGCFLIDVSPSIVFDSHPPMKDPTILVDPQVTPVEMTEYDPFPSVPRISPKCGAGHYYAFPVYDSSRKLIRESMNIDAFNWLYQMNRNRDDSSPTGCNSTAAFDTVPCGSAPLHCADDYKLKVTLGDTDFTPYFGNYHPDSSSFPAGPREWFLVDGYKNSHPQPLSSIFEGLKAGLEEFKNRRVEGDAACIAFYDAELEWPRMVKLIGETEAEWNYLIDFLDNSNLDSTFTAQDLSDDSGATDPSDYASPLERTIRHGLFPKVGAHTNTSKALRWALSEFGNNDIEGKAPTSDFIVLVSDGLNNCQDCTVGSCSPGCSNNIGVHLQSMWEIENMARQILVPGKIPLHALLIGEMVKPNTASCAKDSEYRTKYGKDHDLLGGFVAGGPNGEVLSSDYTYPYSQLDIDKLRSSFESGPYYNANYEWYRIAALTRGIWGPIRPQGPAATNCSDADPDNDSDPVFTDPRSGTDQIKAYMQQIVGENPYTIVDVGY